MLRRATHSCEATTPSDPPAGVQLTCPGASARTAFTAVTHTVPSWLRVSTQGTGGRRGPLEGVLALLSAQPQALAPGRRSRKCRQRKLRAAAARGARRRPAGARWARTLPASHPPAGPRPPPPSQEPPASRTKEAQLASVPPACLCVGRGRGELNALCDLDTEALPAPGLTPS